jgi:hypothetical protein
MTNMRKPQYLSFSLLSLLLIIQLTPTPVRAWSLENAGFTPVAVPTGLVQFISPAQADLNADGIPETLALTVDQLAILSGDGSVWESPAGWNVVQSAFTDLDRDGTPEAALLVWRPFQPWPVDEFLPYGGRIDDFHDRQGNSCHLILIGWIRGGYGELWAGSALANPLTAFAAADLDGDSAQELITLEGRYAVKRSSPARTLKVWEWNGFGFSVVSYLEGSFPLLVLVREENGTILILTP